MFMKLEYYNYEKPMILGDIIILWLDLFELFSGCEKNNILSSVTLYGEKKCGIMPTIIERGV
jgi:hypothetical protein